MPHVGRSRGLPPADQEAVTRVVHAFVPGNLCATSWSLRLFYVTRPSAPLSPEQADALDGLARRGWQVVSSHEYALSHGEWYPT